MKIEVTSKPLHDVAADALVVIHEKGAMLGVSESPTLSRHFKAFAADVESGGSKREWFCTLEKESGAKANYLLLDSATFGNAMPHDEMLKMAAARAVAACRDYSLSKIAFAVHHKLAPAKAAAIAEGAILGDFNDTRFKGKDAKKTKRADLSLTFVTAPDAAKAVEEAVRTRAVIAEAANTARELVNAPHHEVTPEALADHARALAKKYKFEVQVWDEKQLKAGGYLPTYHVGRGSEYKPRMIVLRYKPAKPRSKEHIGLIGKGMTFDSGGLCIKTKEAMHTMNIDMGGAAAVLGAMEAIGQIKPSVRITAVITSAHNAIDGAAYYPGCVLQAKNGKTIYVENTDAEGRLILSDAYYRAGEEGVETMVDFATLTGACVLALGPAIAGLFTDDEELRAQLFQAGESTGDNVWPLPIVKEYESSMNHHLADLNNMSSEKAGGGAIHATNFLKHFVPAGIRWAHVDIAGPVSNQGKRRYYKPGASGYGVRLIMEWLRAKVDGGK